jgi:tetratricopeptide (TPR) repeat protein
MIHLIQRTALHIIWICLITLLPFASSAQFIQSIDSKTIDSLELLLPGSEGEKRIDLLNELAELYAWYNPDKAEIYINNALESSRKIGYKIGEGTAIYTEGYRKHIMGDPIGAIDLYQKSIGIIEQTSAYSILGKIYHRLSTALFLDGSDKKKWLDYFPDVVKNYQAAGDKQEEATYYLNVSGAYFRIGQPEKGLEYLNKYWEISKEVGTSNLYFAIGYAIAAACYIRMGDIERTLLYNKKSIDQFDENVFEERSLKSQVEWIQGIFYKSVNKIDSAKHYFIKSLKISKPNGNAYCEMQAYQNLAHVSLMLSDFKNCILYCDSAILNASYIDSTGKFYKNDSLNHCIAMSEDIFIPLSKLHRRYYAWDVLNACYSMLWESYLGLGKSDMAIQIQSPWMKVRDSIYSFRRNKDILEINLSYETEKKEQQLARLEEDNQLKEMRLRQSKWIVAGLIIIVLMILSMAIILIRQNKLRNEQRTLLLQQRLFRLQMNPHFLYNSLASIQNFIIHKNPSEASSYLSRFSKLVRQILNSSASEYIALDEELDSIENYLSLQKIRYHDMFDYSIDADETMDSETTSIPPMLAQPFIENAIEHGFKKKDSKGFIQINIKQKKDYFILEIEDNGVGRSKAKELEKAERKDHKSMATTITTDRLDALNKKLKQKIRFEIIDLKDGAGNANGTRVVFEIPLSL